MVAVALMVKPENTIENKGFPLQKKAWYKL